MPYNVWKYFQKGYVLENYKCSFFGHRKIEITEELKEKLNYIIEDLIAFNNVATFLFGSRSEFNDLCHRIVTELKSKYPHIKRIAYTCQNESGFLESEKEHWERVYKSVLKKEAHLLFYEEEYHHKTKYSAGKASYVERNQAMITNSDYCVFYYNQNYKPELRKHSKQDFSHYQPKSGTAIAYTYAKAKKKNIINLFEINKKD